MAHLTFHRRETTQDGIPSSIPVGGSSSTPTAPSSEDLLARDLMAVQKELEKWNAAGLMTKAEEIEEFDLVLFWQVSFYNYLFDNQH